MASIEPTALSRRLERDGDDVLLVDIRHEEEFADWHIPDSEHVDVYDELEDDPDAAKERLGDLPREGELVTVCTVGVMSDRATDLLREEGYDAKTLEDGMAGWSRVHRTAPVEADIDGTLVQVARPGTGCLSHVLISDGEAVVFDPSSYLEEYEAVVDEHDATLVGVFDTHAHADHVSGGPDLAARHEVPYYLHPEDATGRDDVHELPDESTVPVGSVDVEVIHTPGHSPGSVTYAVEDEVLLTGDTLFHESVGRVELGIDAGLEETDVEDNAATLYEGLQRLQDYGDDPLVLPAHDPGSPDPPVTARMSEVAERNDGLQHDRESFVAMLADDVPDQPANFERIKRVNAGVESVADDELDDLELGPNNCAAN